EPGPLGGLVAGLDRETDLDRAPLLSVRREQGILSRLEDDRAVTAGVLTPDDDVAAQDGGPVGVLHPLEQRPRPAGAVVAEAVRVGRTREEVAERREARAVGRQGQLAGERERAHLGVV